MQKLEKTDNNFKQGFNFHLSSVLERQPTNQQNQKKPPSSRSPYSKIEEIHLEPSFIKVKGEKRFIVFKIDEVIDRRSPHRSKIDDSDRSQFFMQGIELEIPKPKFDFNFYYDEKDLNLTGNFQDGDLDNKEARVKISEGLWKESQGKEVDIYYDRLVKKRRDLEREGVVVLTLRNNMIIPKDVSELNKVYPHREASRI